MASRYTVRDKEGEKSWYSVGFKFFPTDEEIIVHYLLLAKRPGMHPLNALIWSVDGLYEHDPLDLWRHQPRIKRVMESYFLTESLHPFKNQKGNYWEAQKGSLVPITSGNGSVIGYRETFVYQRDGHATSWVIHEYRLTKEPGYMARAKNPLVGISMIICKLFIRGREGEVMEREMRKTCKEFTIRRWHLPAIYRDSDKKLGQPSKRFPPPAQKQSDGVVNEDENKFIIGFRFRPTDEELIVYYLTSKILEQPLPDGFVRLLPGGTRFFSNHPTKLMRMAIPMKRVSERYFLVKRSCLVGRQSQRVEDASTTRSQQAPDPAPISGIWVNREADKMIKHEKGGFIGFRATFLFFDGGRETDWVVHEYRLQKHLWLVAERPRDYWVLCKLFNKAHSNFHGANLELATGGNINNPAHEAEEDHPARKKARIHAEEEQ